MAEDLVQTLTRFHRDVVLPDIERVVGALEERVNARFDSVVGHFDAMYQRFERLEDELSRLLGVTVDLPRR